MLDTANKIVSSENEELILVDEADNEVGYLSKKKCHDGNGILHRAFSLFVFNTDGQLLLQKRSPSKRLWPSYWSNSCCSHPRKGESMQAATRRRLGEELGIGADLEFIYKFSYQAKFGERGSENELCSVYLGRTEQAPSANTTEIAEVRYLSRRLLDKELEDGANKFTPWLKLEWERLCGEFAQRLAAYSR